MSKNDPKITKFDKYDVEANIEEVENNDEQSVFKYGFTALSNPKNVRLSIEGITRISGDSVERDEILNKDENDVPKILTMIYQELFPTFFLLSKTLNVSCPPHQIGSMGIGQIADTDEQMSEENVTLENKSEATVEEPATTVEEPATTVEEPATTVEEPATEPSNEQELKNPDVSQPTV